MRIPRRRVFKIIVQGRDEWLEEAGSRTVLETQHALSQKFSGQSVRVIEQYLGGARAQLPVEEEE